MKIFVFLSSFLAIYSPVKADNDTQKLIDLLQVLSGIKTTTQSGLAVQTMAIQAILKLRNGQLPKDLDNWIKTAEYLINKSSSSREVDTSCTSCLAPININHLSNYGCWCNLGDNILSGQSTPKDDFDQACKDLQYCLQCTILDNKDNETCDLSSNNYNVPFFIANGVESDCALANPSSECAARICYCQTIWTQKVIDLSFGGSDLTAGNDHSDSGWDYDTECPAIAGLTSSDLFGAGVTECCGDYPDRHAITDGGTCCIGVGNSYDSETQICCPDSIIDMPIPEITPHEHDFEMNMIDADGMIRVSAEAFKDGNFIGHEQCFQIRPSTDENGVEEYYKEGNFIYMTDCDESSRYQKWDYIKKNKYVTQVDDAGKKWCWVCSEFNIKIMPCADKVKKDSDSKKFKYKNGQIRILFSQGDHLVMAWTVGDGNKDEAIHYAKNHVTQFGTMEITGHDHE